MWVGKREDGIEDVLVGEVRIGMRQMVNQKRNETDVLFGRVPTARVPLEQRSGFNVETVLRQTVLTLSSGGVHLY